MTEHKLTVNVVVVPKAVTLKEGVVYLFQGGQLHDCGTPRCITGHADDAARYFDQGDLDLAKMALQSLAEHFNNNWEYGPKHDSPYVIQETP